MGVVDAIEWACGLCGCHIQNDWVRRTRNLHQVLLKLEYASTETIWMTQKATAMDNWWLAASSQQCAHSCIMSHAECFGETSNHPGDWAPYSPDLVPCDFWLFPKLKSPLKEKIFQNINEIQEYDREADGDWENCVRSQGACFEGDWGVIVLCTIFLVSCIFFSKCLFFLVHGWIFSGQITYLVSDKVHALNQHAKHPVYWLIGPSNCFLRFL